MRIDAAAIVALALLTGCAVQRAQVAQDAQAKMIGMSKEQVLACMGPPANRAAEGATEVWSYNSGGSTITYSDDAATVSVIGNQAIVSGGGSSYSMRLHCRIDVAMIAGRVARLNYSGPTGGALARGEQCAYAVENCVK